MADRIFIEALRCRVKVGLTASERARRQRILIDLELEWDLRPAGRSDRVERTLDYAEVAETVRRVVEGRTFRLVEAVAEQVSGLVLKRFGPKQVCVKIRKSSVPGAESVGVQVIRSKRHTSRKRSRSPKASLR